MPRDCLGIRGFHIEAVSNEAWLALAYLIIAGSIMGFTAYVWLLHHESPTRVGTYAYVNPVVAVLVGFFFGGETLGLRTVMGTALVLVSVVVVTVTGRENKEDRFQELSTDPKQPANISTDLAS